jgi:hypothetical protein
MSGATKAAAAAILLVILAQLPGAVAQAPGQQALAQGGLEKLVAPVALYPDDLLAVVLRAATQPVQVVQAARFLDRYAKDKNLKPNPAWIEPVSILLNYPAVLRKMNDDLDWTEQLGEAVQARQDEVLAAIQHFRRRAAAAGNLRSDDKLAVTQQGGAYMIESVNPQVIYVPVYDPVAVLIPQPAPPPPVYVPTPYPAYYEPYPAGAAAAGFFFGAATTAWALNWHDYDIDEDDVREFQQSRQQSLSERQQSRQEAAQQRQQTRQESAGQRQQARQEARQPTAQPLGSGAGQQDLRAVLGGERPSQMPAGGRAAAPGGGQWGGPGAPGGYQPRQEWGGFQERPGYQPQRQPGQDFQRRAPQTMDAFSYGSGREAHQAGNRGAQSRNVGGGGRQFSGGGRGGRGGRR